MKQLEGKKTYICAFLIGIVVVAAQLGYIDANMRDTLLGILGAGGLVAMRSAMSK